MAEGEEKEELLNQYGKDQLETPENVETNDEEEAVFRRGNINDTDIILIYINFMINVRIFFLLFQCNK